MKSLLFFLIVISVFIFNGCRKNTVIINNLQTQKSEYIVQGDKTNILESVYNKFNKCYSNRNTTYHRTRTYGVNYINIMDSDVGTRTIYVENVSPTDVRIYASLPFDTTPSSKREAEVFRMGIFGEAGCPK